jgi:hypothetical protein
LQSGKTSENEAEREWNSRKYLPISSVTLGSFIC